jgi:hypothetical protein
VDFCAHCDQPVGEHEQWTVVSASGALFRAHLTCPPPGPVCASAEGTVDTEVLARPPRHCRDDEQVPQRGWVVQGDSQVFKEGELAGQFVALRMNGARWDLEFEFLGEGLDNKVRWR